MKHTKRIVAVILTALLVTGICPVNNVLAEDEITADVEEEMQVVSSYEGEEDIENWDIDCDGIRINGNWYDSFSSHEKTIKVGDVVDVCSVVYRNNEEFDILLWEQDPDDEDYYIATGYTENYSIQYSLIERFGTEEIPVTDNKDGSATFTAECAGDYMFEMAFYQGDVMHCSSSFEVIIEERPPLPTDFRTAFEVNSSYYGEFDNIEVDTYYVDSDSGQFLVYPVLYVAGKKVQSQWESEEAYYDYKWLSSSNEEVISVEDYGSYSSVSIHETGSAVLTAAFYYAANKEDDPQLLTEATLMVVVTDYEITTKDSFQYNNNAMYIVGETAVIQPEVYKDEWDSESGEYGEWIYEYVDLSDITFDYMIEGLAANRYEVSSDTHTLTIPDIAEETYVVHLTAQKAGTVLTKTSFYVCGAQKPKSLGLYINSFDGLENGIFANRNGMSGFVVAEGVGFEWGRVHFDFLDPETEQPLSWIEEHRISGSDHPNSLLVSGTTGDALIRASLYRELGDTETPLLTEDILLHVYSPINSAKIVLAKGKTFTVKASDAFTNAGYSISSLRSSNDSIFTVENGKITAKEAGYSSIIILTGDFAFSAVPVLVYDAELSYASKTFTGSALKPTVKSIVGPYIFSNGTYENNHTYTSADWSVKYSNNTNAGTATATISLKNGENTSIQFKQTFKITQASIAKAAVTIKDQTYSGSTLKPAPVVKLGSKTLKKGTDYTVKYSGNKNVGTATVTVTGTGNYKGTVKQTFKINPKGTTIKSLTAGTKQITVKWTKQATQTTGYQIQCSLTKDFKKIAGKTLTVSGATKTSGVITGLTKGKTYYVRIRTYKTVSGVKYYSGWKIFSKTVKVK